MHAEAGRWPMVRRGFTYRWTDGTQGLAFVAAAADPEVFAHALRAMATRDALLRYARAVEGGVYFVPSPAAWKHVQRSKPENFENQPDARTMDSRAVNFQRGPKREARMDYPGGTEPRLATLPMASSLLEYLMRVQQLGAMEGGEGGYSLQPQLRPLVEAIHHVLAGGEAEVKVTHRGNPDIVNELNRRAEQATVDANEMNKKAGFYVSLTV
jgi:hypothetical protein